MRACLPRRPHPNRHVLVREVYVPEQVMGKAIDQPLDIFRLE